MLIKLTIAQYEAIERVRNSSIELKRDTTIVEIEGKSYGSDGPPKYVRVTFIAGWGGKGAWDIDREGNSAQVNWNESEISLEYENAQR